jgi:hypothetical protein
VSSRFRGLTRTYRSAGAVAGVLFAITVTASAGPVPDRLDRFREIAASQLSAVQLLDTGAVTEAYRAAYEVLDEEIVESLASGSIFSSTAFLQDRLDAFGDAWGGASVRILRLGSFTVGVFQLGERAIGNSVRVYGRLRDEAALLATLAREGRPSLYPLPAHAASAVQFLVAWDGAPSGRGSSRPVRLEQVRQQGDGVRVVWTTADVYPDGLVARAYWVRGPELRVRYELRYPGWVPGCDGQTEQEDIYRIGPAGTYARISQRQHDAWHRDMRASAARVFGALAAGDRRALTELVPDPRVRERLPARLDAEPVCDAVSGAAGEQVSVAAADERGVPWAMTLQRTGARWRVTGAAPVIP